MKRRNFIKNSALASSALIFLNSFKIPTIESTAPPFGIQLWTLREWLNEDFKKAITYLAKCGFKQIESFEGEKGIFWGLSPADFKNFLADLGLKMVSAHCNPLVDFEKKAEEAAFVGAEYLVCPYVGPQKTADDFKNIADKFNEYGQHCKKNGIRYAYHNHDYSFKPIDGQIPLKILMDNTDKDTIDFELDMFWAKYVDVDPFIYFEEHKNRIKLAHIKDLHIVGKEKLSCDLGTGIIDYRPFLKTALNNGLKYAIVEQEAFTNNSPLQNSLQVNANYMKKYLGK